MLMQFSKPGQQLTFDYLASFITPESNRYRAICEQVQMRSHFQPIYSLAHQRVVGYEALVRPSTTDDNPISPLELFAQADGLEQSVFIDRLCRTLHVSNFMQQADDTTWLFLNLNPSVTIHGIQYGAFFSEMLQHYGIPPHRVVIEILEGQISDEDKLAEAIAYYREMGCLIAIDDFGVGQSNFNRIWRLAPHIVKLDKTLIDHAANSSSVRRVLPELVSLIHQAGSLVLIEGVETEQQAMIALQSDIDFVQGYFFARPDKDLPTTNSIASINQLFTTLHKNYQQEELARKQKLATYSSVFFDAVMKTLDGDAPQQALQVFLDLPAVTCGYVIDEFGSQIGWNFASDNGLPAVDRRFAPLGDTRKANWSRRHYYQQAVSEPGLIQTSKPYLSITTGLMCLTLSVAINTAEGLRVLCGDIIWEDQ
jgi:EAL domain-containing protein (putative c-di-GMP-specific phosphodiesterase class I)